VLAEIPFSGQNECGMKLLVGCFSALLLCAGCTKSPEEPTAVLQPSPTPTNIIGTVIEFGEGGTSEIYRVSGWTGTGKGKTFTWSEGTSAKLALPIPAGSGELTIKMRMGGLVHPPDLLFQPVEVYANGQKIADLQVGEFADFEASIPAAIPNPGGTIEIEFRIPNATSPKSLGVNSDTRDLGIFVAQIEVVKST
jgi:hypothetical protein